MTTIKSYTDIEQSKKLTEILPLESADQTWTRIAIAGANLDVPEELQYRHNGDMPFQYYSGIGIPCWSLAALLELMPKLHKLQHSEEGYYCSLANYKCVTESYNNSVDACYEMILKLHGLNLL